MKSRILIILLTTSFVITANGQAQAPVVDTIMLMSKNLTSFPDSIFKHTELKVLNLGVGWIMYPPLGAKPYAEEHNSISDIPPRIGTLTELRRVDLAFNNIKSLPKEIVSLQKLEFLSLAYNEEFQALKNLAYLKQLHSLKTLDLTGIPEAFLNRETITKELPQVNTLIFEIQKQP